MLFNSHLFILAFLPVTLIGFFWIGGLGRHRVAIAWLVGASLFFYSWWNPAYLGLITPSVIFNYGVGVALGNKPNKALLFFGVAANLATIGYFKYANFFVDSLNATLQSNFFLAKIAHVKLLHQRP